MSRRRSGIPGLSFSWRRALGISAAQARLSRKIGWRSCNVSKPKDAMGRPQRQARRSRENERAMLERSEVLPHTAGTVASCPV